MSIPESIPEDQEEVFQCPTCKTGSMRLDSEAGFWQCDECDWVPTRRRADL